MTTSSPFLPTIEEYAGCLLPRGTCPKMVLTRARAVTSTALRVAQLFILVAPVNRRAVGRPDTSGGHGLAIYSASTQAHCAERRRFRIAFWRRRLHVRIRPPGRYADGSDVMLQSVVRGMSAGRLEVNR